LGVDLVFTVSGNQILPIFDAAGDSGLRLIHMRHESAAAFAAAAAAEMTGRPGVVLTSAGPAFLAALTGLATVASMEYPILFLSGDSPVRNDGFGNFQELDQSAICNEICRGSFRPVSVEGISGAIREAWSLARAGIPRPTHVSLPADILLASSTAESIPESPVPPEAPPRAEQLEACAERLRRARRPMVVLRPFAARGSNGELGRRLAAQLGVACVVTGAPRALADAKYLHLMPHYRNSDCALIVGPSDYALGFIDASIIASGGDVMLIDDAGDPPPKRRVDMHIQTPVQAALRYLVEATSSGGSCDPEWRRLWREEAPLLPVPEVMPGAAHPLHIAGEIREALQPDDILVVEMAASSASGCARACATFRTAGCGTASSASSAIRSRWLSAWPPPGMPAASLPSWATAAPPIIWPNSKPPRATVCRSSR
jgi:acetolactate synthase-1/2/3 large subunit